MDDALLFDLLERAHDQFNRPDFIDNDPILIPHLFSRKEDIEIAGFLTALLAWGRRDIIIRSAKDFLARMDMAPYDFVTQASHEEMARLDSIVHRTFQGPDAKSLVLGLREAYLQHGGLEGLFSRGIHPSHTDVEVAIIHARTRLTAAEGFAPRSEKHLANPAKGSSAKRINMFLRWMVRKDRRGVDFGLWTQISPAQLVCPLDIHTETVGKALGLLSRSQRDWKAARELTDSLRRFCPEDPVKYDFSLFGLGVTGALHESQ